MASATSSMIGDVSDGGERGDDDVDDAAGRRVLQAPVQRERLDEPGGVDLLDRHATEGALVEVAELEHGRRAVADVEQVTRAAAAGGGWRSGRWRRCRGGARRRRARRAHRAPAPPRASGCRRSRRARRRGPRACRRLRMTLAASSPAPRPSTRSGRSVVCARCWRTSQPATARKPIREAATSRRGAAPVSSRAAAATTRAVTSVAAWAWRTRRTASARWYSPRSRRTAVPTIQATTVAATAATRPERRRAEGDSPGNQHHRGEDDAGSPAPVRARASARAASPGGDGSDVRCAWGDCHVGNPMLVG